MVNFQKKESYNVDDLRTIMEILRSDEGCPWDREQNHVSVRKNFLEETYEVLEAIDSGDTELLKEELGDVLMQVVFHARMEEEIGSFNLDDVADGVCKKLILRHPHVFGDVQVENADEVLKNWDAIKKKEKHQESFTETLQNVPKVLPALMRAEKVQKRAADVGFDWENARAAFYKISEEAEELSRAVEDGGGVEEEAGDLLFAVVNVLRLLKLDPEIALNRATDKFTARFAEMERLILADGKSLAEMTLADMDAYWDRVKLSENSRL